MELKRIKKLRELTGVGVMDVKNALVKADGDYDNALKTLKEEGMLIAKKRTAKITRHSTIGYYVHSNQRIAVLVELCCESDITSTSSFFMEFANDIAMHIAATNCDYLSKEDIPNELIEEVDEGKLEDFYQKHCLLEQKYFREEEKSVQDVIMEFIYTHKENVEVKQFVCYEAGRII